MRVTRLVDVPAVRWRNGAGSTRVLGADSSGVEPGQFAWRVSLADIAGDGPFSAYPGVDRHLLACGPGRWELVVDGHVHRLSPLDVVTFGGEAQAAAKLQAGPAMALNVMTLRGQTDAHLAVVPVRGSHELDASAHVRLVVVLDGELAVDGTGSDRLRHGDSIRLESRETLRLVGSGVIADIVLRQLAPP